MSRQVDERVVSMQFDNKHFENNVRTTMSTLDKLKQALHLPGASKGLENISSASKNVNMSNLAGAVDTVRTRFSALEVMGVTALANITNSAVNAGKRMISALTIDPIKAGFDEYETKINSVQTIMSNTASKGTTMADVTRVLDELNKYADMTIYNFAEMTRNIGTFTAAGVGLEDSAAAIQGIANLAAASGSSSQQASTAMYQLSQALSTGTVKLMDWNSVVNAGMGGEKFQEALKATAREHNVAVDSIIEKNGSFRDSLQEGWLSAEILNDTLKKFTIEGAKEYAESMLKSGNYTREQADALIKEAEAMNDAATKVKTFTQLWDTLKEAAQSGWAQTWELIIGDFEEAKTFLSGLSDLFGGIIDASSAARNKLLGGALDSKWSTLSKKIEAAGLSTDTFKAKIIDAAKAGGIPIDDLIKKHGSLEAVISKGLIPVKMIKDAFMNLLDAEQGVTKTTKELGDVVNKVLNGDFGNGKDRIDALTKAGYDYATVQNAVNEKLGVSKRLMSTLSEEQVKNADSLVELSDAQLKSKGYTDEQITALRELQKAAKDSGSSINELINDIAKPSGRELLLDSFRTIIDTCVKSCGALRDAWREIFPPMTSDQLYNIIAGLNSFVKHLSMSDENADKLKRTFKGVFALLDIILTVVGGPLKIAFKAITQLLGMFDLNILDVTASIGDAIVKFRDWIDSTLDFTKVFEKIMPYLKDAATGIRNWIATLKESDNIPRDLILGLINGFKAGVSLLGEAVINLGKIILEKLKGILGIHSPSTETYAIAMDTIQGFINGFKNGSLKVWDLIKGFGSKCLELLQKIDIGQILAIGLGIASVLAGKKMLNIMEMFAAPFEGLGEMFEGIGGMLLGLKSMFKGIGQSFRAEAFKKYAQAVLIFAVAIVVLVGALWLLTKMDSAQLWESVAILAALTAIVAALGFAMSKIGAVRIAGLAAQALSILLISASLLILVHAISKLATLDGGDIAKGIAALAALTILVATLIAVSKLAGQFGKGSGVMLLKISIALLIMVGIIKLISGMSVNDIAKGLTVIAIFELLIIALIAVSKLSGQFSSKAGSMLLKISIALLIMVGVIKLIAGMSTSELTKGITVIALMEGLFVALIAVSKFAGKNANKAGTMLLMMAAAMFILVAVIQQVSKLEDKDISKGLAVIAVLEIFFGALMVVSQFAGKNAIKAGIMLLAMSFALLILAGVLFILSELDPSGLSRALAVVAVLEILFGGLIAVTKLAQGVSKTLIILIVAIGILVLAVAALSFIDAERLKTAAAALSAIMATFALLVAASKYTANIKIAPLLVMVAVVAILAVILYALSKIDPTSTLPNVIALSALLGAMMGAMTVLSLIRVSAKDVGIAALMGLVVAELALVLYALSLMDPTSTLPNVIALSVLLLAMTGAMAVLSVISVSAKDVGIAALMGLVVAELALVLYALSFIDPTSTLPNVLALSVLLLAMTAAMAVLSVISVSAKDVGIAILMGLVVAELALILVAMDQLGVDSALPNALALSVLLIAMSAAMAILSLTRVSAKDVATALLMGLVLAELVLVLFLMESLDVQGPSLETALALSVLLIALSAACLILSAVGATAPAALTGAVALAGVVGILGALLIALGALAQIPGLTWLVDEGIALLGQIGLGLGTFFGNIVGGVMTGISGQLPQVGADLSAFMTALAPFIEGAKSIDGGVLEGVATLAGVILLLTAAQIIQGIASWITGGSSLAQMGTDLSEFMTAVTPFIKGANLIDPKAMEGAKTLAEIVLILTAASFLNGITSWLTGGSSIDTFAEQIVPFGKAIVEFSETVSGKIDEGAVSAAANAGKMMADMASSLPNSGGVVGFFTGENDMDDFGVKLVSFGKSITSFSETVSGNIDEGAITAAANAGKMMADMASTLPNSGGVVGFFTGENDMDDFGLKLVSFGRSISTFSASVSGNIDEGAVTAAASAGKMMAEMAKTLPNSGGVVSWFTGNNDMDDFGLKMVSFGESIVDFSETISGNIDEGAVTAAASAGKMMAEMANSLPNSGGIASWFSGDNDMKSFGGQLKSFGEAICDFSEEVSSVSVDSINNGVTASKKVMDLGSNMPSGGLFSDGANIGTFKTQLLTFAKAVKEFAEDIAGIDGGKIANDVASLKVAVESLKGLGNSGVTEFTNSFTNSGPKVSSAISNMVKDAVSAISSKKNDFKNNGKALITELTTSIESQKTKPATSLKNIMKTTLEAITSKKKDFKDGGKTLVTEFNDGIDSQKSKPTNTLKTMMTSVLSEVKKYKTDFYNAGENCVKGFADGISDNTYRVEAKAKAMAKAAARAAEEALDVNSPSKVFYGIGNFAGVGFVNALDDYKTKSYKAGSAIAEMAKNGLRGAISNINNLISDNMDTQPTIRPILDLSNITSGANALNGILDTTPSIGVLSNLSSINSSMNRNRQNGVGNDDVVSAIKKLEDTIGSLPATQYIVGDVTYDDGSNISDAVQSLVRAARIERRV